jgi:hypothetical protein
MDTYMILIVMEFANVTSDIIFWHITLPAQVLLTYAPESTVGMQQRWTDEEKNLTSSHSGICKTSLCYMSQNLRYFELILEGWSGYLYWLPYTTTLNVQDLEMMNLFRYVPVYCAKKKKEEWVMWTK